MSTHSASELFYGNIKSRYIFNKKRDLLFEYISKSGKKFILKAKTKTGTHINFQEKINFSALKKMLEESEWYISY